MSNVNASGTSDESAVSPNFVTYPVHSNSSAAMEAGFDTSAGTYMQHGSYFWFSRVLKCPVSYLSPWSYFVFSFIQSFILQQLSISVRRRKAFISVHKKTSWALAVYLTWATLLMNRMTVTNHDVPTRHSLQQSYDDCLEDKREDYQNCSVLYSTIVLSYMHVHEQFLQLN